MFDGRLLLAIGTVHHDGFDFDVQSHLLHLTRSLLHGLKGILQQYGLDVGKDAYLEVDLYDAPDVLFVKLALKSAQDALYDRYFVHASGIDRLPLLQLAEVPARFFTKVFVVDEL